MIATGEAGVMELATQAAVVMVLFSLMVQNSATELTRLIGACLVHRDPAPKRIHFTQRALSLGVVLQIRSNLQRRTVVVGSGRFGVDDRQRLVVSREPCVLSYWGGWGGAGGSAAH